MNLSSDRACFDFGFLYVGWNNVPHKSPNDDYGDETFGFSVGNLYIGCYAGSGWHIGFVDEYGVLIE